MTRKPRQISGNDPLAAIPKDYNRYCDRIIGNAGGLFIDPSVLTRAAEIEADGGTVEDIIFWDSFIKWAKNNPIFPFYSDLVAGYSPSWGVKGTTTASKQYSVISSAQDLEQVAGAFQPIINIADLNGRTRLIFDGVIDVLGPTAFSLTRPETVVMGGYKTIAHNNGDVVFDGNTALSMTLRNAFSADKIQMIAEAAKTITGDLVTGVDGNVRSLFNAASSAIQIDNTAEVTGDTGTGNAAGFTLGASAAGLIPANFAVGMVVILNSAVDANYAAKMAAIYAFSKEAYGTP